MNELLTPQEALQALIDGKDVEYRNCMSEWNDLNPDTSYIRLLVNKSAQYRIKLKKQETIKIGDVSFPKPYQGEMEYDQFYYYPTIDFKSLYDSTFWNGTPTDHMLMGRNLVHLTKENAIAHAKALLKLSGSIYENQ